MSSRNIKALFFDVDGTLVGYNSHRINQRDMESLQKLHDLGMKLFIASGRDFEIVEEAKAIAPVRHLMDGFIGINGQQCMLFDGTVISSYLMDAEDFAAVRDFCSEHHIALLYYYGADTYVTEMTDLVREFSTYVNIAMPPVRPLSKDATTPKKVCIYVTEAQEIELIRPLLHHTLTANNHDYLSDMIPEGIGKHIGIRDICAHFGFSEEETMAFGDGENDVSMLQYAGIGVAMGIAPEEVKKTADYVTGSSEEAGITTALEHFHIL